MWLFKSDSELIVEDSIVVDNNRIGSTKQIVIKGVISNSKIVKKWSLEKNLKNKFALISVYNKNGLKSLCENLIKYNYKFISTGSTAKKNKKLWFRMFRNF